MVPWSIRSKVQLNGIYLEIKVQQSLSSEDRTLEDSLTEGQLAANKSNIINITNKSVNFSSKTEIQVCIENIEILKCKPVSRSRQRRRHC